MQETIEQRRTFIKELRERTAQARHERVCVVAEATPSNRTLLNREINKSKVVFGD